MAKRRTIAELCADRYDNPELSAAIIEDATRLKNIDGIESGALTLPSHLEACQWHRRITGVGDVTEEAVAQQKRIAELEKAVAALIDPAKPPDQGYLKQLEERIKLLEGGPK